MPKSRDPDFDQPVFMIGVAAEMLGVHPQSLRLYEKQGLIAPARSDGNTRLYSQEDIETAQVVLRLTRELGVNLAGAEVILNLRRRLMTTLALLKDVFDVLAEEQPDVCSHLTERFMDPYQELLRDTLGLEINESDLHEGPHS